MKVLAISAGHIPGVDSGAVSGGWQEADLNVKIVRKTANLLREHKIGVLEVPDNLTLVQSIQWINEREDQIDLCFEVHINAGGGSGVEVWHYHNSKESAKLSQWLVDALSVETGLPNRGIKDETLSRFGRLGFVHDTKPLACLVECGFIDNPIDRRVLGNDEGLTQFAKGLTRGSLGFLGIAWKPSTPTPATPLPHPLPDEALDAQIALLNEKHSSFLEDFGKMSEHLGLLENRSMENQSRIAEILEALSKIKNIL